MRTIQSLLFATVLAASACHMGKGSSNPRPDYGELVAYEAPPSPLEIEFQEKEGHVWVHGRWARMNDQWVWQPGFHQKVVAGKLWSNGYWQHKKGEFVWREGAWIDPRPGFAYVPGRFDKRGEAYVWILEKWERDESATVAGSP